MERTGTLSHDLNPSQAKGVFTVLGVVVVLGGLPLASGMPESAHDS